MYWKPRSEWLNGWASGYFSWASISNVSVRIESFLSDILIPTGYRQYKSSIGAINNFSPVVGTLISVISVFHFSNGLSALKSLFKIFSAVTSGVDLIYVLDLDLFLNDDLYSTTLHYTPCHLDENIGFRCVVVLLKGTNTPFTTDEIKNDQDKLLGKRNKWVIAHPDSPKAKAGAYVGLIGENLELD